MSSWFRHRPSYVDRAWAKSKVQHDRIPVLRELPLPAIAIIALLIVVNLAVWTACGIVLVSFLFDSLCSDKSPLIPDAELPYVRERQDHASQYLSHQSLVLLLPLLYYHGRWDFAMPLMRTTFRYSHPFSSALVKLTISV